MTAKSTTGLMYVNGKVFCHTLEDVQRDVKVYGATAIPSGRYPVVSTWSAHFKRELPLLVYVEGYEGIRIHCGNKAEDTEGCILVARNLLNMDFIQGESKDLEQQLAKLVKSTIAKGEKVFCTVHKFQA
jgi:hypothetical protein